MSYQIKTTPRFDKSFKKLDGYTQKMVKTWITKNLVGTNNPKIHGKSLTGNYSGKWRYRIGDYRLICLIEDNELIIFALEIGHRKNIYKKLIVQ